MNILITGAAGHIGSYLVDNFYKIKKIKKVFFLDNFSNEKYNIFFKLHKKNYFFLFKDLKIKDTLKNLKKIDIIIHLASMTSPEESLKQEKLYYKNNMECFYNVLKYCIKNKSKLIHISSTSVYGTNEKIIDENTKIVKAQSPYANIKLIEEKILKKNSNKLQYTTLRFGTIVGISRGMRFQTAANKFCFNTIMKIAVPVWKNSLDQRRPYLSINDAFKTIKFIIEKNIFLNDSFNILTTNNTVREIIHIIKKFNFNPIIRITNSKIMNKYSYHVRRDKILKLGLKLGSDIKKDIKNTLLLFQYRKFKWTR
jgi:nucleoside-diphosphate-sugar epimerase